MNTSILIAGIILTSTAVLAAADDERFRKLVPADAKVEQLAGGMKFTEGPVWSDEDSGFLIFSDIPANELKRWDAKNGLTVFRADSNQTNGNTRDGNGRLISCEHAARRVTRTEKDGTTTVVASAYTGKFNSPNDAVVMRDGTMWFTDPPYGLPKGEKRELDKNYVFIVRDDLHVAPAASDFDMPNGLCLSPDEKKLYVADSGKPHHIRVFDVMSTVGDDPAAGRPAVSWQLANGRVFCVIDNGVPDGIRCDEHGNVWSSAGDGVHVFAPDGKLIGKVRVPESPANLCFGGAEGKTLLITARTSLYAIKTNVRGAAWPK